MLYLLNPRVWIALGVTAILVFSHSWVYRHGKKIVMAEVAAATAQANAESRRLEQARQRMVDDAASMAAARARDDRARAASVDRTINGLRNTLDATQRNAEKSLASCTATVAAYRTVFESCTAEYRSMGEDASRHASDSLTLQMSWPK